MLWGAVVNALLGKVAPKVADYYIEKQALEHSLKVEQLRGKIAWEQALTKRASESEGRDHDWEMARLEDARHSYKDEWVLFLLSIPLILVFIPQTQQYVLDGFSVLDKTPQWYQWMIGLIFTAIYGIRTWRRSFNK
jgi:hypothetical protein